MSSQLSAPSCPPAAEGEPVIYLSPSRPHSTITTGHEIQSSPHRGPLCGPSPPDSTLLPVQDPSGEPASHSSPRERGL